MYVPRFGETNIVYDVIDNKNNNILTTTTDKTYGTITIQDGILSHSDNESNFNSPTGIIYGSDTGGKWSLASTDITNGILTKSNDLTFDSHTGLLYGKSTGKQTWSLDSVVIDKGILTKSNDILGFNSLTGILYGSATGDTWSLESTKITDGIFTRSNNTLVFNSPTGIIYGSDTGGTWSLESTKITDGIFTRSNNTLVFNNPNGLLYGSIKDDVWSLNKVNNLTSYADSNDYVLYYGKDSNNENKVTPHWRILTIDGKNFSMQNGEVSHQWRNIVTNDDSNIVSIQTEYLNDQDYGIYNNNGKVVKLSTKVLNDIGLKFFSPSEINESGYITTNVIIYNSSTDSVSFPVNYYNVYNFHCDDNQYLNIDDRSYMQNLQYTNGFYNFTTVSNNLPVYDQIKNTYDGFYNFIETNKINSNTCYLHFTTSLFVDSIVMPSPNIDKYADYSIDNISNYDCIIGIYTNFGKIEPNTFYQNVFFCNSNTPVLSAEDTSPLLGYLIVDLANIDKSGKVNINQLYDIDSTIPYNTNIVNYDIDQLKNGILTFRPLFYKSKDNNITSLHYDKKTYSNFYKRITHLDSASLSIKQNDDSDSYGILSILERDKDYIYYKDNLQLTENVTIDSNFNNMFHNYTIAIPNDGIVSIKDIDKVNERASIILNYIYCDTDKNKNVYYLNNCIKPFSYIVDERNNYYLSDPILGNVLNNNNNLYNVCLLTDDYTIISNKQIILSKNYYTFISSTNESITVKNNNTDKEITLKGSYPSCNNGYISIDDIDNIYEINKFNNLVNKDNNDISLEYKTYVVQNFRINTSVIYNNSNTSNLHILVNDTIDASTYNIQYSIDNTIYEVGTPLYKTNNIYVTEGKISRFTDNIISFNSNMYGIDNNNNRYEYYPIIFNNDYVYRKELLIPNNDTFKYTLFGVIYNNTRYIFSAKDVSLNIYGQIVVNTDKYYYNSNEKAIYSINGDNKIVSSSLIIYNEYIEILNNNYACNYITRTINENNNDTSKRFYYLYNKINIPIDYKSLNSNIIHINNPILGQNLYKPSTTNQYNLLSTTEINENIYNKNILISPENNKITLTLNELNNSNNLTDENTTKAIITEEGIIVIKNKSFIMEITNPDEFIYSDNHIDIPFFDTPIEKDMKIVLKPISKYSILSYNRKSYNNNETYTDQIYTLAKNVGFKISLCNIYVTLTSYIGEYPSMIN